MNNASFYSAARFGQRLHLPVITEMIMRFSGNAAQTALTLNDGITCGFFISQTDYKKVVILHFETA